MFFNYRFLHTKLAATSLQDILSDFRTAAECGLGDEESLLLENTLRVGELNQMTCVGQKAFKRFCSIWCVGECLTTTQAGSGRRVQTSEETSVHQKA